MKKKTTLLLILLIITLSIYASNINVQISAEENKYRPISLELSTHDPITITSDSNFTDYGFLGTGTSEDPYLIEGYNIITTSTSSIHITDTTKYFIIRNCYVDANNNGIYIRFAADGTATVINNTCSNNGGTGISLFFSGSSTVVNNTCSYNDWGIYLETSGNSTIINNTCNDNDRNDISLRNSGSSTIINNTCSNNNNYGIYLYFSSSSTVVNNTFTNCGLYIYENTLDAYLSNTVGNNWVNGKKLGFYTNLDSMIITEQVYGQLILINCTNVIVRDQILNNATIGLFLYSCPSSVIINNTCNNNGYGIRLYFSNSSTVANNTCSNNNRSDGISLFFSDSSTVANNTCSNNHSEGISLHSSDSSTVINNTCSSNNLEGIYLSSSDSSTVINNTCNNNFNRGLVLGSSDCVVTYNLIQENRCYGVYSTPSSENNLIHHNTFVDNNLGGTSQANDRGTNNLWFDTITLEGNYWSDWSGTGNYSIDGDANSVDYFPLDEPVEYPTDENQLNFTFALLLLVVPLFLKRIISKKVKKNRPAVRNCMRK